MTNFKVIWNWIDRDLDHSHPWSMLLILVPFLPMGIALGFTDDEDTRVAFLVGGLAVAAPWFLYVMWRGLRNVARSFDVAAKYFRGLPISRTERILRLISGVVAAVAVFAVMRYLGN